MSAANLSPEEAAEVRRFGLDHPEDGLVRDEDGAILGIDWAAKAAGLRRDDLGDLQ